MLRVSLQRAPLASVGTKLGFCRFRRLSLPKAGSSTSSGRFACNALVAKNVTLCRGDRGL